MFVHLLLLLVGVFACSTAVIMIKACSEDAVLLSAYRLLIAAIALTPVFWRDYRRHRDRYGWPQLRASLLPGLLLGIHFISWIVAARMTTAANASLIVNLVPVVMPFLLIALVGERLTGGERIGTFVALIGLLLLSAADFQLSMTHFWGDMLCLGSMLFFATYLAFGRRNRKFPSMWLYVVPLYYFAGLFCLAIALFRVNPIKPYSLHNLLMIFGLGLIPTVVGHSILNQSLKNLRGQIVSIMNMGQFIFAGIMAYFLLDEMPAASFYPASLLLVAGGIVAVCARPR